MIAIDDEVSDIISEIDRENYPPYPANLLLLDSLESPIKKVRELSSLGKFVPLIQL